MTENEIRYLQDTKLISAKKYVLRNTVPEQLQHVRSEMFEVIDAYTDYLISDHGGDEKTELGKEIIDLQTACQTLLEILFSEDEIVHLHRLVRDKNNVRGYYTEVTIRRMPNNERS